MSIYKKEVIIIDFKIEKILFLDVFIFNEK